MSIQHPSLRDIAKGDDLVLALPPIDLETELALDLDDIVEVWVALATKATATATWSGSLTGGEVSKDAANARLLITIPASAVLTFPSALYAFAKAELSDGYLGHLLRGGDAGKLNFGDSPLAASGVS